MEDGEGFKLTIGAPSATFAFLIGKKGAVKQQIERETGAKLWIPGKNSADEFVVVRAASKAAILRAHSRVSTLLEEAKKKLPYTHFISLPLGTDAGIYKMGQTLITKFEELAEKGNVEGWDRSIAPSPSKLHVTVLMLRLLTQEEVQRAAAILDGLAPKIYDILETRSMLVRLGGLSIMNENAAAADVLYMNVSDPEAKDNAQSRLVKLCEGVIAAFDDAGLVDEREKRRALKLHVTLLNTRYRRSGSGESELGRVPFDARPFLSLSATADFGQHVIREVHLSERGKSDSSGYYHCVTKIKLP